MAAEAAGVGTWDLDLGSGVLHSSPRCREILGFSRDTSFSYDEFVSLLHPEDRPMVVDLIARATDPAGPGTYETEYRVNVGATTRWISARGRATFVQEGESRKALRFVGTVLDRTEQKRAQEALIESEKLAVSGRLIAVIAHEIRNPLNALGELLYLIGGSKTDEERTLFLEDAQRELAALVAIANSTLRLHRQNDDGRAFDLSALANSVLVLLHGRIALCGIRVEAQIMPKVMVALSQGEMRQVLLNLISNALDALPHGGRLYLRVREARRRDGSRQIRVTVADSGEGMSSTVVQRIFDPFYTTKGDSGNGIGLWLIQEILRKHDSRLHVRSREGRGSVFSFCLTAGDAARTADGQRTHSTPGTSSSG